MSSMTGKVVPCTMIKAIIIDDDMTTIDGLSNAVPWQRYNIELCATASNGQEGLALIEQHHPQLILTDIYMPVMDGIEMLKRVRAAGNDAEVIILSGYEDFKYAQSAVKLRVADYLSKPATIMEIEEVLRAVTERIAASRQGAQEGEELRELLELHRPVTRKLLQQGLLEANFTRTPFFEKACKQLQLSFDNQAFTIVLLEYGIPRSRHDVKRSDLYIYTYALSNLIEELSQDSREVLLANIEQHTIALIVRMPKHLREETIKQRVKYVAGQYTEKIKMYLKLEVWAAIGKTVYSVHELAAAFSAALDLLSKREYVHQQWLMEDQAEASQHAQELPRLTESYQQLIRHLLDGQQEMVEHGIGSISASLQQYEGLTVHMLKNAIVELIGMLTVALYDEGILFEDLQLRQQWHKEIDRIHHLNDYIDYMSELMLQACQVLANRGSHKHQRTVDFMKRYVQEHYSEDFTLDDIADKVFLTRNYLSQLFKQVTGENYNSYITRIRMEKAKEMMLSGKYKLYEISQMVGYKNNAYFSQQFKKYTGKSPSEFC
ncbi:response regulator [Paenibacillus montaniterrae]|nr:response regulator [Paenibacillus montaniterrae]